MLWHDTWKPNNSSLGIVSVNRFSGNEHADDNRRTCCQATKHTIWILSETMFSIRSVQSDYVESVGWDSSSTLVDAGSSISTVTLRVVGGDEKGSLIFDTVIGTWTWERLHWQRPVAYTKDRLIVSRNVTLTLIPARSQLNGDLMRVLEC
jgi:hypothetical protein